MQNDNSFKDQRARERRTIQSILTTIILAVASSCGVAEDLKNSAPPAAVPDIYKTERLVQWPQDQNFYSDGYTFTLYVQHGLLNVLSLLEGGHEVPRFDGSNPDNAAHTVFALKDLENDANAKVSKVQLTIGLRVAPNRLPHGTTVALTLREKSVNPKYSGTAEESASKEVNIVVIANRPTIALFNAPGSVTAGKSADLSWRVNDCKRVELLENQSVIGAQDATGFSETIEGSKSLVVQQRTVFSLRAQDALRNTVQQDSELLVTSPPPCPDNPSGQASYFTFCVTCPGGSLGDYQSEWVQQACVEADAEKIVHLHNSNCKVETGGCPRKPWPSPSPTPTSTTS